MPLTTADEKYIQDIITAINAYATAMETFTSGAATTAANALAASLTTATSTYNTSVQQEGQ